MLLCFLIRVDHIYGTDNLFTHKPFIVVWYIEHCTNLGFPQALRPLETVPAVKEIANVIDVFKKQVAADRAVIVKVRRDSIFVLYYARLLCSLAKPNMIST